jgi:FlaA1/EpsC-like NDP-sugar epimerase
MLIFGGTGSLGKALLKHLLHDYTIYVFSRDEAKHVVIKSMYPGVKSIIGDIRDKEAVFNAIIKVSPDVIINASALKNVPEVEEVPMEGIKTSLIGTENLNNAVKLYSLHRNSPVKILTISTDKACKPVNAYGMAKALQERLHIRCNGGGLICNAVRYGNVLESRGSLIPLIKQRFKDNKKVFITHTSMTRFFLTLDSSVDLIKRALEDDEGGKIFVPVVKSAKIKDIMEVFCTFYNKDSSFVERSKIRPGEKLDEILVSTEEVSRTERKDDVFIIHDIFEDRIFSDIEEELSSGSKDTLLSIDEIREFLAINDCLE